MNSLLIILDGMGKMMVKTNPFLPIHAQTLQDAQPYLWLFYLDAAEQLILFLGEVNECRIDNFGVDLCR